MTDYSPLATVHPHAEARPDGVIDSRIASHFLKPGDVLIKFAGTSASVTEDVIMDGQKAVQKLSGIFHKELKKGDPTCFHAVIYIGNGQTAEAHGGNLSTAHVGLRSIDDHAGFLFRIYRCTDQGLAANAAAVGELWARPNRMKYDVPVFVPFEQAVFGPKAHSEAHVFGQAAKLLGGPPSFSKMFCSQFVIAAFQGAVVGKQLELQPDLAAKNVGMPDGLALHATNSSPLALHAKLEAHPAMWTAIGEVLVRVETDVNDKTGAGSDEDYQVGKNVEKSLQQLGNPTEKRWAQGDWRYARNPWSLCAYEGKIYIASGNANNPPPAPNAGPIDLWVFDPSFAHDEETHGFSIEYVVNDEGIDIFRKLSDGALWIPGLDSHVTGRDDGKVTGESKLQELKRKFKTAVDVPKDWALGNAYRKADIWEQLRTIPNGIHVYDLLEFEGKLFAASSAVIGGMICVSEDRGLSWKHALSKALPWSRTRSLFVLEDFGKERLFGSTNGAAVYRYEPETNSASEVPVDLFPGITDSDTRKETFAARTTQFKKQVVYIGAVKIIDHDWAPQGLYAAAKIDQARSVLLPGGAMPRAILASEDGGTLYVLGSTQPNKDTTRIAVFSTTDAELKEWKELFFFRAGTFARSFALLDGDFYLGLGSDPEMISDHTGLILKISRESYQ